MADGSALDFGAIVHGLRLAIFVFRRARILYQNEAAVKLHARLQKEYQADLIVMLRDHLLRIMELDSVRGLKATLRESVISPLATPFGVKSFGLQAGPTAGVPAAFTQHTLVLPYNDIEAVEAAFSANEGQIAGIILEPG